MRCDTFIRRNGHGGNYYPHDPWFDDREKTHMQNRNRTGAFKRDSDIAIQHFIDSLDIFIPKDELTEGLRWILEIMP